MAPSAIFTLCLLVLACTDRATCSFWNPNPDDITFKLYSSTGSDRYTRIRTDDKESVDNSSLDPTLPLKIVVHGFMETTKKSWMHEIQEQWMKKEPLNVILVDWGPLCYFAYFYGSSANTNYVGLEIARLLKLLESYKGMSPSNTHIIGHSLGAQVAGVAGHHIGKHGIPLARITGLDPAGPDFIQKEEKFRLDYKDADFVDVIHTNAGYGIWDAFRYGYTYPLGHVAFIMNGGKDQKGCDIPPWHMCSHHRSVLYYIESLENDEPGYGYQCKDYETFQTGACLNNPRNAIGYHVKKEPGPYPLSYYADTKAEPSFLGRSISINLNLGENNHMDNECNQHGQVRVGIHMPDKEGKKSVPMFSYNDDLCSNSANTKLYVVLTGTALESTKISLTYDKRAGRFTYPSPHLEVTHIEAFDAFDKTRYCVSGQTDLQTGKQQQFTPRQGGC